MFFISTCELNQKIHKQSSVKNFRNYRKEIKILYIDLFRYIGKYVLESRKMNFQFLRQEENLSTTIVSLWQRLTVNQEDTRT